MSEQAFDSGFSLVKHHLPEKPARAIVQATRRRSRFVSVSGNVLLALVYNTLEIACPGLMDRLWSKMASDEYYEAVSKAK